MGDLREGWHGRPKGGGEDLVVFLCLCFLHISSFRLTFVALRCNVHVTCYVICDLSPHAAPTESGGQRRVWKGKGVQRRVWCAENRKWAGRC